MNIVGNTEKIIQLRELNPGDVFQFGGEFYIKTAKTDETEYDTITINIKDGTEFELANDRLVLKVDCELVVH